MMQSHKELAVVDDVLPEADALAVGGQSKRNNRSPQQGPDSTAVIGNAGHGGGGSGRGCLCGGRQRMLLDLC